MSLVAYDLSDSEPETAPVNQILQKTKSGYAEEISIDPTTFKLLKREHESSGLRRNYSKRDKGYAGVTHGKYAYKGPWAEYSESDSEEAPLTDKESTECSISYMKPPGIATASECVVPEKQIRIYPGHTGGTTSVEWFPKSGHLLLSCGNDNSILLWDAYHDRQVLRRFTGHEDAVKGLSFDGSGEKFLSCSYDNTVKLWNTETGKCLRTYSQDSLPTVVKFCPSQNDEFLVGSADGRILHYETRTNEIIRTYDHHLGAIGSLCFIDNQFVSSSDDKTLRLWKWNVNFPVRCVADPAQVAMSHTCAHPQEPIIVAQCLNRISCFGSKLRKDKKKVFKGSTSQTQPDFSPDGKILISGEGGTVNCWDWNTGELVRKLKVCSSVIATVKFHPRESWIAASGTNGDIFIWG